MNPPICGRCPGCGSREHYLMRPLQRVAFRNDRVCLQCGTRYSPPTPLWGAITFIVLGLILAVGCTISLIIAIGQKWPVGLPLNLAFAILGVIVLRQGILSLREDVAIAPDLPPAPAPPPRTLKQWVIAYQSQLAGAGFMAIFILGCAVAGYFEHVAELGRQVQQKAREAELRAAIRKLEQLGGSVGGTTNGEVNSISLQRADYYAQRFASETVTKREIVDDDVPIVTSFPKLEYLSVMSTEITDVGLRQLPPLPRLTALAVQCPRVTEDGVTVIGEMEVLTYLNLSGTSISDLSKLKFERKPRLHDLNLARTPVTSDALAALNSLKSLTKLNLSETEIDDDGLKTLARLPKLEDLRLDDTQVSDDGILHLKSLSNLVFLSVDKTNVTPNGRLALKRHLPNCKIILKWGPTLGGVLIAPNE